MADEMRHGKQYRQCNTCRQWLPLDSDYFRIKACDKNGTQHFMLICKACNDKQRRGQKVSREEHLAMQKAANRTRRCMFCGEQIPYSFEHHTCLRCRPFESATEATRKAKVTSPTCVMFVDSSVEGCIGTKPRVCYKCHFYKDKEDK